MHKGFTLLELLVVLSIVGLLAGISVVNGSRIIRSGDTQKQVESLISFLTHSRSISISEAVDIKITCDNEGCISTDPDNNAIDSVQVSGDAVLETVPKNATFTITAPYGVVEDPVLDTYTFTLMEGDQPMDAVYYYLLSGLISPYANE